MRLKPFAEVGYVYYSPDFTPVATGFSDWGKWYLGNQIDWIIFGTDTKIIRAQIGFWPHATLKTRLQFHNTRPARVPGPGQGGDLANEISWITEWYPRPNLWVNFLLGNSRPGRALGTSGLSNPFSSLNSGAAPLGARNSLDLVLAAGVTF